MNDQQRTRPPQTADERLTLTGYLQYQRDTLAWKCDGLSPEQLRTRAVPPSTMSLLGLVRHMADVEQGWFRTVLNGEDCTPHFTDPDTGAYTDFDVDTADPAEAFALWETECALSRAVMDGIESLDLTRHDEDEVVSVRWVLVHMIEEYARHNGHADLLRERIDGATGE